MGASIMSARYLTSDPTQSLALTRDGRPYMDFAAAPSLFLEEDIRQENLLLVHRQKVCEDLKQSEINEAQAVAARTEAERFAEAKIQEERAAAARAEQERASQERLQTAQAAEEAASVARRAEATAVEARRAQDCAYSERKSLEAKAYRIAPINSALSGRGGYLMD